MMKGMFGFFPRALLAVAIIVVGLVVGAELRVSRERLATGQAASAGTNQPSVIPSVTTTPALKPQQPTPSTPNAVRTVVPTPFATPYTGPMSVVTGTVSVGGKAMRGAQVMVYPSNEFNHGPTPMPPEAAMATTDDRGGYQVSVPPGAYRIGAFRSYDLSFQPTDGFANITWFGDGYAIGLGKDLVVNGNTRADIAMLRVVKLAGRVVGRDGVAVPNAQVGLSRFYGGITFPLVPLGSGQTDRTGAFRLAIAAMPLTLVAYASGRTDAAWVSMDLDLRVDQMDLVVTIDRGNIVSGTLRDAVGRPLPNLNFSVTLDDSVVVCGSCSARSDSAGHFALTLPNGTLRFITWAQPREPALRSKEYVISGDQSLDPVLQSR
jgi:hypothetical protein